MNGQRTVPGRIINLLDTVAGNTPYGILPGILFLKRNIIKLLFQPVHFSCILYPFKRRGCLAGQFRKMRRLASGIKDRHRHCFVEPFCHRFSEKCRIYREKRAGRHKTCKHLRILLKAIPGLSAAHGKTGSVNTARIDIVALLQPFDQFHCFCRSDELVVFHRYKQKAVFMRNLPPAGHIGQIHGRITAAVETQDQRDRSPIEQPVVIISKISYFMSFFIFKRTPVIGRSRDRHAARVLRHPQRRKIRLQFHSAAPHFKFLYKSGEISLIISLFFYQKMLTSAKCLIGLTAVCDAQHGNIPALHVRYHIQPLHGAHCRRDLARPPEILSLQGF